MTITRGEWQELQSTTTGAAPGQAVTTIITTTPQRFLHQRADALYRWFDRFPRLSNTLRTLLALFRGT